MTSEKSIAPKSPECAISLTHKHKQNTQTMGQHAITHLSHAFAVATSIFTERLRRHLDALVVAVNAALERMLRDVNRHRHQLPAEFQPVADNGKVLLRNGLKDPNRYVDPSVHRVTKTGRTYRKPRQVFCFICGREFGTKSLKIHWKSCRKKVAREVKKLPSHLRPSLSFIPPDESIYPFPNFKTSTDDVFLDYNAEVCMAETSKLIGLYCTVRI